MRLDLRPLFVVLVVAGHGGLELPHPPAERTPEIGQPLGAEDDQHDDEDDDDLWCTDIRHVQSMVVAGAEAACRLRSACTRAILRATIPNSRNMPLIGFV